MAVQEDEPPGIDIDINAISAVFSQHLVLKTLHSEDVLFLWAELSKGIDDGGFPSILQAKHSDDNEVGVVSHEVIDAITEDMILINKLDSLSQLGDSFVTHRISPVDHFGDSWRL